MSDIVENVVDDNGNKIEYKLDGRGKWAKQPISFVDEYGNRIKAELQSSQWSTDDRFDGYLVTPVNVEPDMSPDDPRRDAAYKKIRSDAERYFKEHPSEKPASDMILETTYLSIQTEKYARKRQAEGKSSCLENVFIHEMDNKHQARNYCWDQMTGRMPADASSEKVEAAMKRDNAHGIIKKEYDEFQESAKRGQASLENRVAKAQDMRYNAHFSRRGDSGVKMTVKPEKADDRTLNEDEKNFLVKHKYEQLKSKKSR